MEESAVIRGANRKGGVKSGRRREAERHVAAKQVFVRPPAPSAERVRCEITREGGRRRHARAKVAEE